MRLLTILLVVGSPVFSFAQQTSEKDSPEETAERSQTTKLLDELEDINTRMTSTTIVSVERVKKILDELQVQARERGVTGIQLTDATEAVMEALDDSVSRLRFDAINVRDRVQNEVLPDYVALTDVVRRRMRGTQPQDPNRAEYEMVLDQAIYNKEALEGHLSRLNTGIQRLGEVQAFLRGKFDILALWKQVNLKAERLIELLGQFNRQLEYINKILSPDQVQQRSMKHIDVEVSPGDLLQRSK